ncbi:MAG: hypothetical protein V7676_15225 [Parasphingorhabdus sp.]|jgi:hypothetical protein|uniref:hypothetical protein n=1 Tax=Parasphingorhabdus sp. TaxID=2709688 RepID=UPI003003A243|tara:strand:+ start:4776 stop:5183 length:408 start_codon:yes stop_codon:yes gene_type:complete
MIPQRSSVQRVIPHHDYQRTLDRQLRHAKIQRYQKLSFGNLVYVAFRLIGWFATTLLIGAGLFVVLFFMVANGSLFGFFEQLNLLGGHYVVAPPEARAAFDSKLYFIAGFVFLLTGAFRMSGLLSIFESGDSDDQ